MITYCDVNTCEECPRYADDCDGDKYLDRYPTMHEYAEGKRINPKLTDLISRADAIEAFGLSEKTRKYGGDHSGYDTMLKYEIQDVLENLPSAETEWIPCNKQMPDELEAVNVTWVNHLAPPYYKHIEDVPFVDSAVYYRGKWYWWDATVIDVLAEYGEDCNAEQIDKDIEVVAWMPLPTPYKGGDDE